MLLKITNICDMNCIHCSSDCTMNSKNPHMNKKVLFDSINFINKIEPDILIVSGGEPTLHPNFIEYIRILKSNLQVSQIEISSNGEWILKHKKEALKIISFNNPIVTWRVTSDKRFYNRKINLNDEIWNKPGFTLTNNIPEIYPLGRALDNEIWNKVESSTCASIRILFNKINDLNIIGATKILSDSKNYCCPCINTDGSIILGETPSCKPIGTIYNDIDYFSSKIKNFTCKKCQWINKNLSDEYKQFIHFE